MSDNVFNFPVIYGDGKSVYDGYIKSLMNNLVVYGYLPDDWETVELDLDNAEPGEKVLGTLIKNEKILYKMYVIVSETFEEYLRNLDMATFDQYKKLIEDKTIPYHEINSRLFDMRYGELDNEYVYCITSAVNLLRNMCFFSIKARFDFWGTVGIRKDWLAVKVE